MKALVIRQPWAALIVAGYKDIENRSWPTRHRGPLLIQSSQRTPPRELEEGIEFAARQGIVVEPQTLQYGGIIGMVDVMDCVSESDSPWFFGPIGWRLKNPRPLPFLPHTGRLGLFDVSEDVLRRLQVGQM